MASPTSPSPLVISTTDWLLLIALSVLWGGSFYFAKVAVLEIPPLTLALARVLIAGAVIAVLIRPLGGAFPATLPPGKCSRWSRRSTTRSRSR